MTTGTIIRILIIEWMNMVIHLKVPSNCTALLLPMETSKVTKF